MMHGHGGNIFALASELGCPPDQILDFSSNINPLETMPKILNHLGQNLKGIVTLPEVDNRGIIRDFSASCQIPEDQLLAGNGTTQFIYALPKALDIRRALILAPTYSDYADGCRFHGVSWNYFFTKETDAFNPCLDKLAQAIQGCDTVYICNPNNPTGCLIPGRSLRALCETHAETRFIVDESYLPFAENGQDHSLLHTDLPNLIVLHSLSKIFGIPGLRIGFIKASPTTIKTLQSHLPPWSVNTLAQTVAAYLLTHPDETGGFISRTRSYLVSERERLMERLSPCQALRCYPSTTSFILMRLPRGMQAGTLCRHLASQRILIRDCGNFEGLDKRYVRIALKTPEANMVVAQALIRWFDHRAVSMGENI